MKKLKKPTTKRERVGSIVDLLAHETNLRVILARRFENERMVFSVRESQISSLLYVFSRGDVEGGTLALKLEHVEAALVGAGIAVRLKDGSMIGFKQPPRSPIL